MLYDINVFKEKSVCEYVLEDRSFKQATRKCACFHSLPCLLSHKTSCS